VVLVLAQVEVAHADLAEETGMVLIHHDAVVMLATSVTAASRVLPVLANAAVAGTDVSALLAVLPKTCDHDSHARRQRCWRPAPGRLRLLAARTPPGRWQAPQRRADG
jgi:hypothetical protein